MIVDALERKYQHLIGTAVPEPILNLLRGSNQRGNARLVFRDAHGGASA
ncbi:hypothetical protein [Burkholderia glumae]|nr:hypothetical protein [Burkholderia glumae]